MANTAAVDKEIEHLVHFIKTLGKDNGDGTFTTTFSVLFKDDKVANTLESLAGTLKAAKRRKVVAYKSELLLQGMSDNEVITLNKQ